MADETKDMTGSEPVRKHDEAAQPGGLYIVGGRPGTDGKHYGGKVVDCEGETLNEFGANEVNTGKPKEAPKAPKPSGK